MSRYQQVPVKDLIVDERYQRPLDEKRVARIVNHFEPALFGALDVSRRNGKAAVWDGQHRLAAAVERGMSKVPCLVHQNLSPEREAELFVEAQRNRRSVSALERFRARVFSGDPTAEAIEQTVERYGFILASRSSSGAGRQHAIAGIVELERIYMRGLLEDTLGLLSALWAGDDQSTDRGLIAGVANLLDEYGDRLGDEQIAKLKQTAPVDILRRARARLTGAGGTYLVAAVTQELRSAAGVRGRPRKRTRAKAAA